MSKPYSLFSEIYTNPSHDDNSTVASSSHPISSIKRPSSATSRRSISKERKNKLDHTKQSNGTELDGVKTFMFQVSREDLIVEIQDLKKKALTCESTIHNLKAENQRLSKELTRQQQRLDKLLESSMGNRSALPPDWRKDTEKSLLVRQLKRQIHELRSSLEIKEIELEAERKSSKSSNVLVIAFERDEYFAEVQRLQKIIKVLRHQLNEEYHSNNNNNNSISYKKDSSSSDFHRETLSDHPSLSKGISGRKVMDLNDGRNMITPTTPMDNKVRPSSASRRRRPKPQVAGITGPSNPDTVIAFDDFKASKTQNKAKQKKVQNEKTIEKGLDDTKQVQDGNDKNNINNVHNGIEESQDSQIVINPLSNHHHPRPVIHLEKNNSNSSNSNSPKTHGDKTYSKSYGEYKFASPITIHKSLNPVTSKLSITTDYEINELVEARYLGVGEWTEAFIRSINEDKSILIQFRNREENFRISPKKVRRKADVYSPRFTSEDIFSNTSNTNISNTTATITTTQSMEISKAKFKFGDSVQALYYNGQTWYGGKIKSSYQTSGGFLYDVLYDDGERENRISEDKIKLSEDSPEKKIKDAILSPNSIGGSAKVAMEKRLSAMTEILPDMVDEEPSEIPEEDITGVSALRIGGAALDEDITPTNQKGISSKIDKKDALSGYLNNLSDDDISLEDGTIPEYGQMEIVKSTKNSDKTSQINKTSMKNSISMEDYREDFNE